VVAHPPISAWSGTDVNTCRQRVDFYDDDPEFTEALTWMMAVEQHLGPFEGPDEFVCHQDPDTLVDSTQCAGCPLSTGCFGVIEMDIADARRKILDDVEI